MTEQAAPPAEPVVQEPLKEEVKEEVTEQLAPAQDDSLADRVAEIVYEKMKVFTTDLLTASRDAVEAAQSVMPQQSNAPAPAAPPEPDQKPVRRHKLFGTPLKRGE